MARNWALVVGINNYNPLNFTPLKYAKRDAERVTEFFEAAGFEVCCFTDDSPPLTLPSGHTILTQPTYGNLVTFLQDRFETEFLTTGDNCWFFFAGHGERHQDRDYLMPIDANSRGAEVIAGLTINYVQERLSRCGADNVIMILDACRSEGSRDGGGIRAETQKGLITIASCQPTQKSWEIDELGQGVFTHAFLEALQLSGETSCATVERLGKYLQQRVPALCQQYRKAPAQLPRIGVEPIEKRHFILLPKHALQADIDQLKLDAFLLLREKSQGIKTQDLILAEQICVRLNALTMGRDLEVIDLLLKIRGKVQNMTLQPTSGTSNSKTEVPSNLETPSRNESKDSTPSKKALASPEEFPDEGVFDSEDILRSARGIDYTGLRDFLKANNWRAADEETYKIMRRIWGGSLSFTEKSILQFPCIDLLTIDGLWLKYSAGKFGFSIQKQIYVSCGANLNNIRFGNVMVWRKFSERVGWQQRIPREGFFLKYYYRMIDNADYSTSAPTGHLPWLWGCGKNKYGRPREENGGYLSGTLSYVDRGFAILALRLMRCEH